MNSPFYWFLGITLTLLGGIGYFLRGALFSISTIAAQHAKIYAVAYVKGGALIAIAAGGAFGTGYQALPPPMQASMPWAPYVIFFWLPISAGLAVLVAFLDRSAQTATKDAQAVGLLPPAAPLALPNPFIPAPQPPPST